MQSDFSNALVSGDTAPNANKSERGFTLVELMVVVAIIALLAAIVIPNYVHARAQAAVSQSEANIKQIATSLELYYADNQAYPTTGQPVTPALFGGATNAYMTATPTNALARQSYVYAPVLGGTNTTTGSYTIADPGAYDATTLASLPQKGGALCGQAACTHINYDPQDGIYGS